jgi:hypothetical protein
VIIPTRGISQIWRKVREESKKRFKESYYIFWRLAVNLLSKYGGDFRWWKKKISQNLMN